MTEDGKILPSSLSSHSLLSVVDGSTVGYDLLTFHADNLTVMRRSLPVLLARKLQLR